MFYFRPPPPQAYFEEVVLPLAHEAALPEAVTRLSLSAAPSQAADAAAQRAAAEEEVRATGRPRS